MAFKFVAMLAFTTIASAGHIESQPQYYQAVPAEHSVGLAPSHHVLAKKIEEYDPHPQYKYSYDVQDSITGDSKSQSETRNGDAVEGEYSLVDADGYKRIVHYTADSEHGFNAVVSRVPLNGVSHENKHVVKATPVAYTASPTIVKTVQPVAYSSPNYYSSEPAHYAVQAPAIHAASSHYKTAYSAPHVVKTVAPHSVSNAAPIVLKNVVPVTHSAPSYYKSAPVAYHAAPASYAHAHESYSAPAPVIVSSSPQNFGYSH